MFSARFFVVAAFVASVVAVPAQNERRNGGGHGDVSVCSAGNVYCCNNVQNASSVNWQELCGGDMSILEGLLGGSTIPIGVDCSPIALSAGGSCNQQTVCCDGANMGQGVNVNCNAYNGGVSGTLLDIAGL